MSASADPEIKPWDKDPDESSKRYFAFCLYRDMGANERSLSKVAKELAGANKMPARSRLKHLKEWSSEGKWVSRVEAWDVEQDRLARIADEQAKKKMKKRKLDTALLIYSKTLKRIQLLNPELDPKDLKVSDALKGIEIASKLETQALGEPDQIIKHEGNLNIKARWLQELREDKEKDHDASANTIQQAVKNTDPPSP